MAGWTEHEQSDPRLFEALALLEDERMKIAGEVQARETARVIAALFGG